MFVKEGIIQPQDLLSKVGLDEKFRSSAMYVPRVEYDLAQLSIAEYNRTLREANARIGSLSVSLTTAISELEKLKAKISLGKRVDKILLRIMTICDSKVDINEDAPWKLVVGDLDHDQIGFLLLISKSLDTTIINQLRGRLRGINLIVQLQIDTFLLYDRPRKKTLSERMLEWNPPKSNVFFE